MAGSKSVFLSYASQDIAAARGMAAALRASGVDVWLDQHALRGGDAWQESIQQQIRECRLFVPIISTATQARGEGYFRLEWKLAVDRSHQMASDQCFIVPVLIDGTPTADARVPDRFRDYQWINLPRGETDPQFVDRIVGLLHQQRMGGASSLPTAVQRAIPRLPHVPAKPQRRWPRFLALGVCLALLATALITVRRLAYVAPYSMNDRRMSFAVLPFVAAPQDSHAQEVASANFEASAAALESNNTWAHTVDRGAVQNATKDSPSIREIAKRLNVHFLLRGTVSPVSAGYDVDLNMIDGESERTIATDTLKIVNPDLTAASRNAYDDSVAGLIYGALQREVQRAEDRPERELDVRDLTFRGYVYWYQHAGSADAYKISQGLLDRALAQSPTDFLALRSMAEINLCDCIHAWAIDVGKETAIGAAALDKLDRLYPQVQTASLRLKVLMLRGQYAQALNLSDFSLGRDPNNMTFLQYHIVSLIHLGRANDALPLVGKLEEQNVRNKADISALIAAVNYATGDYAAAAAHAEAAMAVMTDQDFSNSTIGSVQLTYAAAEARLGNVRLAQAAMKKFRVVAPQATTTTKILEWMYPTADLYGFQPLFDGLSLADIPN